MNLCIVGKLILLLFIIIMNASNANSQVKKDTSLESAIDTFINYPEIAKWLQYGNIKEDSTLYFIDLNKVIKKAFANTWMGFKLNFVNDRLLIDSLKHFQPHFVFQGRRKYFVLIVNRQTPGKTVLMLLHPYNNMSADELLYFIRGNSILSLKQAWVYYDEAKHKLSF